MEDSSVKKAIEILKDFGKQVTVKSNGTYQTDDGKIACEIAIEALEKQLTKKPTYISDVNDGENYVGRIGRCPSCNEIVDETMLVCDCTQKLDWS